MEPDAHADDCSVVLDMLGVRAVRVGQKGTVLTHVGCASGAPLLVRGARRAGTSFVGVGFEGSSSSAAATRASIEEQRLTDILLVRHEAVLGGDHAGGAVGLERLFALPEVRSATVLCLGYFESGGEGGVERGIEAAPDDAEGGGERGGGERGCGKGGG